MFNKYLYNIVCTIIFGQKPKLYNTNFCISNQNYSSWLGSSEIQKFLLLKNRKIF